MLRVTRAILHVFDFESGSTYFSDAPLDLDNRQAKSYVQRHLRKTLANAESRHGEFPEESDFAGGLREYLAGEVDFVPFSLQIAQWFWEELRRSDNLEECDLLVADFTDTGEALKAAPDAPQAAVDEAFEGEGRRYFAILLLPRKKAFIHEVGASNEILRQDSALPNPSQKVDTYVLIDAQTLGIDYHDKDRSVAGETVQLVPGKLLRCRETPSSHEVIDEVTVIVQDLAEEYGLTPAVEVSRAKAAVARHADLEETVEPAAVGRAVFEDRPEVAERFEREAQERRLPEEVPVRRGVANRLAGKHRIRTDTGIEISFPSDLADKPGYLDFSRDQDGHIRITISNVASIENR